MHNWHRFDCIVMPHCTHCTRAQFCRMTTSVDNIQWFHKHVSSTYHLLETSVPIADVAMHTIKYIKRLTLTQVSKKVKSDFFRMLINYIKAQGNLVAFFIEPITTRLLELIDDDEFNEDDFFGISFVHAKSPIISLIRTYSARHSIGKQQIWG